MKGETSFTNIDTLIDQLNQSKNKWVSLPISNKIEILKQLKELTGEYAQEWVDLSVKNKEIVQDSPLVGEEWSTGPWAVIFTVSAYIKSLEEIKKNGTTYGLIKGIESHKNGQLKVKVFPSDFYENLLFNQIKGEVWMDKSVTEKNLKEQMSSLYHQDNVEGKVSLVLGAGNINSIAPLDVLYNLLVKGEVALLKMNPINDYLTPILQKIFQPFIADNFVHIINGGIDEGKYLTAHPMIETIHITGSEKTHDAIVYGVGEEGKERKIKNKPILDKSKPIRSELGGVGPMIVVPGPWNNADIDFQSQNIVTAKLHNGGHNCVASQVLILQEGWDKADKLLKKVREYMINIPERKAYYPGASEKQQLVKKNYPLAEELKGEVPRTLVTDLDSSNPNEYTFKNEFFAPIYAQTTIKGDTPLEFLQNAVTFCNDSLHGTLGATILIHPDTLNELGDDFEDCLANLKYGAIGVNVWNGVAFLLPQCTWGAFPGHTYDDIQSGIGVVHNSLMFDKPEKTVLYGPFRTMPRAMNFAPPILPWFVTNKTADATMKSITQFSLKPNILDVPKIFILALQG